MRRLRSGSESGLRALVVALVVVVVVVVVASSGQTGPRRSGSDVDPQAKQHGPRSKAHASALVTAGAAPGEVHTSALVTAGAARGEVRASAEAKAESGPEPRPNSLLQVRPGASACDQWDWRTPLLPLPSSEPPSPAVGQKAAEEPAEGLESARDVSGPALARLQSSPARTERDAAPEEPLLILRSRCLAPAQATHAHSKPVPPLPSCEAADCKPVPASEKPEPDPERSASLLPAQATHSHGKPLPSAEATDLKPVPEASPAQERDTAPQASHSTHSNTRPLQTALLSWSMSGRSMSPQATHSTTRPLQTAAAGCQHEEPERQVENVVQAHHRCQHEEPERQVENVVQARQLASSCPLACH